MTGSGFDGFLSYDDNWFQIIIIFGCDCDALWSYCDDVTISTIKIKNICDDICSQNKIK